MVLDNLNGNGNIPATTRRNTYKKHTYIVYYNCQYTKYYEVRLSNSIKNSMSEFWKRHSQYQE